MPLKQPLPEIGSTVAPESIREISSMGEEERFGSKENLKSFRLRGKGAGKAAPAFLRDVGTAAATPTSRKGVALFLAASRPVRRSRALGDAFLILASRKIALLPTRLASGDTGVQGLYFISLGVIEGTTFRETSRKGFPLKRGKVAAMRESFRSPQREKVEINGVLLGIGTALARPATLLSARFMRPVEEGRLRTLAAAERYMGRHLEGKAASLGATGEGRLSGTASAILGLRSLAANLSRISFGGNQKTAEVLAAAKLSIIKGALEASSIAATMA